MLIAPRRMVVALALALAASFLASAQAVAYPVVPLLAKISPPKGPTTGGTAVTLSGAAFVHVTRVLFGATPVSFRVISTQKIVARSPRHSAGKVSVRVVNSQNAKSSGHWFVFYAR